MSCRGFVRQFVIAERKGADKALHLEDKEVKLLPLPILPSAPTHIHKAQAPLWKSGIERLKRARGLEGPEQENVF